MTVTLTSAPPSQQRPGDWLYLSYAGIVTPSTTDWVGIFASNDSNSNDVIAYAYLNSAPATPHTPGATAAAAGNVWLQLPNVSSIYQEGVYYLKLFSNGTLTVLATLPRMTVAKPKGVPSIRDGLLKPGPADNPTITIGSANANSSITGAGFLAGLTVLPSDTRLRINGAPPLTVSGASYPQNLLYRSNSGRTSSLGNGLPYVIEFDIYANGIEIACYSGGRSPNVFVNDVQQTVTALANDGNMRNILLSWGTTDFRRIRLEFASGQPLAGFYMRAVDSLFPPTCRTGPRIIVLGDSHSDGTGTVDGVTTWEYIMGQLLGTRDVWQSAIGGTGYLQDASGVGVHFRSRMAADVQPYNPDIIVFAGGSDDTLFTTAAVATEAQACWDQIHTWFPTTQIVSVATWGWAGHFPTLGPYDTAIAAAADAYGIPHISPYSEGWLYGTGYAGHLTSDGNTDVFVGTDQIHPVQAGHLYDGRRVAAKLAQLLPHLVV